MGVTEGRNKEEQNNTEQIFFIKGKFRTFITESAKGSGKN